MAMPDQFKQDVAQSHQNPGLLDYPFGRRGLCGGASARSPGQLARRSVVPELAAWRRKALLPAGRAAPFRTRPISAALQAVHSPVARLAQARASLPRVPNAEGCRRLLRQARGGRPLRRRSPRTAKDSADAYAKLHQVPADPQAITGALKGVLTDLDPSVVTGMSPGLKSTILDIGNTVQNLPEANMGQLNSWSRQINAAAQRERYPTDQVVAGKITGAFDDLIQQGGAGDLNEAAQTAAQKSIMAQNLAEWHAQEQRDWCSALARLPLLTEAENWYQKHGQPQPGYQDLVDLYKQSQSQQDPSWALSHLAGHALGTAGYAMGGFPGSMIGEAAGVLGVKPMIKGMFWWSQAERYGEEYSARLLIRNLQGCSRLEPSRLLKSAI